MRVRTRLVAGPGKKRTRHTVATLITAVLAASLASCGSDNPGTSSSEEKLTRVVFAAASESASYGPLYVGMAEGIFEKYGLDLEVKILTPSATIAAVLSGDADFASDGPALAKAILEKPTAKVIFGRGRTPFFIAVKEGVTSLEQLKGVKIATTNPGSSSSAVTRTAMSQAGLTLGDDYDLVYVGKGNAKIAALRSGNVDATTLSPPQTSVALSLGGFHLIDITEYATLSIQAVSTELAESNPEAVENFVKAYAEATRIANADKGTTVQALQSQGGISDKSVATDAWEIYRHAWSVIPVSESEGKRILGELTPPSDADPNGFIDNSFIEKVGSENQAVPPPK